MPAHFEQLLLDDLQLLALLAGHPVRLLAQHPHQADIGLSPVRVAVDAESVQRRPVRGLGVGFALGFGEQVIHSL